jgi:uncharacterized protein DUF222/HNH endonuclease
MRRSAQMSVLHREQLADIAEFDRSEGWRGDGAVSMIAWVTAQCGVGTSTARQWVRAAANLESLPCLAEGLATGELSLDLVEPLAEVASPETDAALREASSHWSVRQARELAALHRAQREAQAAAAAAAAAAEDGDGDGGGGGTDAREFERRTLRFNDTRHSVWVAFTKDDYVVAKSALVGRVSAETLERRPHEDPTGAKTRGTPSSADTAGEWVDPLGYVPYDQRLYDALLHLFSVASAPSQGRHRRAFRPRMVVHAPLEMLLAVGNGEVAEIAGVGPVSAEVARRLACDADVVLSVEGRDGCILDQGRARRDPTVAQRIEIDRRDKGCRFPGCNYNEFTNVHHVRHWTKGGETNLDNLVTLCGRHHSAVHELGWAMVGDADRVLTFTSPHGRTMTSAPSPTWRRSASREGGSDGSTRHRPLRR